MTDKMIEKANGFYDYNRIRHFAYCSEMQELITKILDKNKLSYNNISGRVKTRKSFLEKCKKDKYSHYNNITDIVGIRIITYLLSDVENISALIESEFCVDYNNSKDKADDLNNNEFGYRGLHYILRLNEKRTSLSEYSSYSNMWFELQIKTLPQHAWSEMSHDRHYKFKGIVPDKINRRIHGAAALLETIDNEFQSIADELDIHLDEVTARIKRGELDIGIDSTSLMRYACIKFDTPIIHKNFDGKDHEIISEMLNYGIKNLRDIEDIIPCDIHLKLDGIKNYATNLVVFYRQIMVIHDSKRYFENSWNGDWSSIRSQSKANLFKAYGIDIDSLKQRYLHDESN